MQFMRIQVCMTEVVICVKQKSFRLCWLFSEVLHFFSCIEIVYDGLINDCSMIAILLLRCQKLNTSVVTVIEKD